MIINSRYQRHATLGLCALLAALIFFTLIYMLSTWRSDWILAHKEIAAPAIAVTKTDTTLPGEHLFGQSLSGEVPITSLQLRVTGIVKIDNDENNLSSKAYISMSQQPSKIYQVGDTLVGGVKIYDITSDAIILENDGHLEKLPLPREKLEFKPRNTEEPL